MSSIAPGLRASLLLLLAAFGVAGAPVPGAAQDADEEILSYDVVVDVATDGWLEVTEEIRVRVLGRQIRRGIYRDFPTTFPRPGGVGTIRAPFEVVGVLRNGQPEPYSLEDVSGPAGRGGVRVRIGEASRLLDHGEHAYTLVYRTARWVEQGEEVDRLTWNATGHGWDFPILGASARVLLPRPVEPGEVALDGWTGPEGSTESDLTASFDPDLGPAGGAVFRTTGPLGPREGMTVRVTVPARVVDAPTEAQRREWRRMDWGGWIDAGLVLLLVLAVYLLMWHRVGRDPEGRAIVTGYEPPDDFSPAALGHVVDRGYETRQLTAAVVSLAVKGWVEIDREGPDWVIRRTRDASGRPLSSDEERLLRDLFGTTEPTGKKVELTGSSDPTVREAAEAFRKKLDREHEKRYFVLNRGWFTAGLALSVLGFAALAWRVRGSVPEGAWFLGVWLTFWSIGTFTLVWRVAQAWRAVLGRRSAVGYFGALFITLFAVPFVGAEIFVGAMLWGMVPAHLPVAAVVLGGVNVLFYHLLERPTMRGRGVLDEAEGFRRFLTATEEDRIRVLQPEDEPLVLFERYLPYALALGVESQWAERFESVLDASKAAAAGSAGGLAWYHHGGAAGGSLSDLSGSLGSAFSSSLSSSSAAPSSSGGSGGGGGGFSGGGGGGGGGGGW